MFDVCLCGPCLSHLLRCHVSNPERWYEWPLRYCIKVYMCHNSYKPTMTVAMINVLICLMILSKVHIKVVLHFLLANWPIHKVNTTLFTLNRQPIISEVPQRHIVNHWIIGCRRTIYFVTLALVNLTFCDKITPWYSLAVALIGSTVPGLLSSASAVTPVPMGVPKVKTTLALRRALYRLVI